MDDDGTMENDDGGGFFNLMGLGDWDFVFD